MLYNRAVIGLAVSILILLNAFCKACTDEPVESSGDVDDICVDTFTKSRADSKVPLPGGALVLKSTSNSKGVFLDPIMQPSPSKKWKYQRCGTPMYLLLSISLAPGDYVQVNRDVYKGNTCVPKFIPMSSDRQFPLIGLVAANETSTFKAFYICPLQDLQKYTKTILECPESAQYAISSPAAFESLLEFLTKEGVQLSLLNNPGKHLCEIFKRTKANCNEFTYVTC